MDTSSVQDQFGPVADVSGTAPPPFDESQELTDVSTSFPGLSFVDLGFGRMFAGASSDVDGSAGVRTSDALGGIEDITMTFTHESVTLFEVEIQVLIEATASVTGDFGSLVASGSTQFSDVGFRVDDATYDWTWSSTPSPNTVIVDDGTLRVVVNEQLESCAGPVGGTDTCSIEVNAVHATFDDGTNFAEIIVGHAEAAVTAQVPEAGAGLLLGSAALGVAVWRRRRA